MSRCHPRAVLRAVEGLRVAVGHVPAFELAVVVPRYTHAGVRYCPIIRAEVPRKDCCVGLGRVLCLDRIRIGANAVLRAVTAGVTVAHEFNLPLGQTLCLTQLAVKIETVERRYAVLTFHAALNEQLMLFLVALRSRVEHERLVLSIQTDHLIRLGGKRFVDPEVELYRLDRRCANGYVIACKCEACIGRAIVKTYAVSICQRSSDVRDASVIRLVRVTCLHAHGAQYAQYNKYSFHLLKCSHLQHGDFSLC